jgi:hypothetical protein
LGGYFGGGGKRFTALCPVKFPQKQIFFVYNFVAI